MSIEKANEGSQLHGVPPLWPLRSSSYDGLVAFVESHGVKFGWERRGYRIYKETVVNYKILDRFPATQEGWTDCWRTIQQKYPGLASAVMQRVQQEERDRQALIAEPTYAEELRSLELLTSLANCVLLGGHGYGEALQPGGRLDLYFTAEGLWATQKGWSTPVIKSPYSDAIAIDFDGPGRITKGGGFIGGGFGLKGAAEGMAIAAILNGITTKSEIRSIIRWESRSMEAFFFTDSATPGDLRIAFSPVRRRIMDPNQFGTRVNDDPLDRLERLAKLHREGSLTDQEFAEMKARIIRE
jgi:hypothetical protein